MQITEEQDHETCRVIVFGRDWTEILLARSEAGLVFPEVTVPRWRRVAENVNEAMRKDWKEEVICLFEVNPPPAGEKSRYIAARHWRCSGESIAPLRWISATDLFEDSFAESRDYAAVRQSLAQCGTSSSVRGIGLFSRPNWFDELCEWVGRSIASKGLYLSGNFRQLNGSSTFSLIRFETNGPAVWFKAVGQPNAREFSITLKLAKLFPQYTAELLAVRPEWNGWLACEVDGTNPGETTDLSLWGRAAASLAGLQIESVRFCDGLLDSRAHNLKSPTLAALVSKFMEVVAGLMRQQSKVPPLILTERDLALVEEHIREGLLELNDFRVPDALGQLDLNPGNILVSPSACVFLDWAEAYVGHPFYCFQYLLEHFRHIVIEAPESEAALTASYLAPWEQLASPEVLNEAMAFAPLLAAFAYAAGTGAWQNPECLRNPQLAGYLRALARRMKREADQLSERRASWLS